VSEFTVDCTVLYCSAGTVDCECIHCELHCLVGACGKAAVAGPECHLGCGHLALGCQAWALGRPHLLAALQAAVTWRSVCPALGTWATYLCAGQTKRTCGAWADC
jgi:hypothetical protein